MSLRSVDLNLVPMLQILLREQSISVAARKSGMSQSAMSDILRRLRVTLNDPLLVRVGRRMELTPQAAELIKSLEAICESLDGFFSKQVFDPTTAERTFVVASSDHAVFLMAGLWLAELERVAPKVQLRFVQLTDKSVDGLASREIDFAVVPSYFLNAVAPAPIRFRRLTRDCPVALFRKGHPLAGLAKLSRTDLSPFRMLSFASDRDLDGVNSIQKGLGEPRFEVAATFSHITLPPYLLLRTNYFTLTSSLIAAGMIKLLPLEARPVTFYPAVVEMGLAWSPVQDKTPAHRWFRETAVRVIRESADLIDDARLEGLE